jgi:thioredoxin 1
MAGNTTTLTDQNFAHEVKEFKGTVLVDFWAPWCTPCQMIAPSVEKLAVQYQGNENVKIAKLNVDDSQETAMEYQILSIPNLKIFRDGEVVDEIVGVVPFPVLQQRVAQAAQTPAAK